MALSTVTPPPTQRPTSTNAPVATTTTTVVSSVTAIPTPTPTLRDTPTSIAATATRTALPTATATKPPTKTATVTATPTNTPATLDVTDKVERLGNPFLTRYPSNAQIYPRNVWDMQLFGNKIYLGSGNSSNNQPGGNAGPVDLWSYDGTTKQFVQEHTVDQEQIDRFRLLNGTLYIPGHDPKQQTVGFYRLENGAWVAYDTIANFQHVYDMTRYETKLFAGLGSNGSVSVSTDNGQSWTNIPIGLLRVYSLFEAHGKLYAAKGIYTDAGYAALAPENQLGLLGIYEYQGGQSFVARPDLKFSVLFPGYDGDLVPNNPWYTIGKIVRQVTFQDRLVYIGGNQFNDHQTLPFGLFVAASIDQVQRVDLPAGSLPWDTLVRNDTLYVLLGTKRTDGSYKVSVLATDDLVTWRERFYFTQETFARSFELTPTRDFIFGLGTGIPTGLTLNDWTTWEMAPSAGTILRVPRAAVPSVP